MTESEQEIEFMTIANDITISDLLFMESVSMKFSKTISLY
jgi:hypothetical protein